MLVVILLVIFFFKQKTAYEMRISDWSSDVCSSDLSHGELPKPPVLLVHGTADPVVPIAALHMSESELKRLGVDVTTHVSYGVAHTVDPVGLRLGRDFVAEAFAR